MDPPQPSSSRVELNPNDVLLGRGDWTVRYEGNVRFRDLIREKRALFGAATGRNARDKIAADVILLIAERGGRFLRRHVEEESKTGAAEGVSPSDSHWIVVDKKVAMKKVKQAFRDKDSWTQAVPPSSTTAAPLNAPPSAMGPYGGVVAPGGANDRRGDGDHARDAMERTLRAYQNEAARREAERTLELEQQLRHAMALSRPADLDAAEAMRIAARSAEMDRLRQLASFPNAMEPNSLVQQTLFSMQQQQQNLQQLELNLRHSSMPLSQLGGLPSSYMLGGGGGGGGNAPFSLTQQLDVVQHLQQLQQQQQRQALLGGRGLTSLLAQNQYRAGLLDPSMLPDSSSSISSLQAALRCHLDGNESARPPLLGGGGAFHVPGGVPPLTDRRHVASSNSANDSIGATSERTTESRRSQKEDPRKKRSAASPSEVDSAHKKRPRTEIKTSSSSSAT